MENIVKLQDQLKNLSDQQLAQEMQSPSGSVPQFLIMTEMNRRNEMRQESKKAPEGTVADELIQQAQQPQGLMNLPDETLAGAAMRARISGQQQQAPDGMVAMPPQQQGMPQGMPQGMADGGAVQFGNIFKNTMAGNAMPSQASGTPELVRQNYMPVNGYVPPTETDVSKFANLFSTVKGAPNPRVRMSDAERYGIPKGMAAPTYGTTPGLNRTFTGREGQNTRYSFANDAARDAYIRSMTPPAAAARTMADGGVAHFDGTERSDVRLEPRDAVPWWGRVLGGMNMDPAIPLGIQALNGMTGSGVTQEDIDDLVNASEGSIRKPKTAPPAAAVSGAPPPSAAEDPMSGGILSGGNPFEGMSGKYASMLQQPPARQPLPQISTYVPEPTPMQSAPAEKLRDYAGETKSEINKLLEGLSGDSDALKQRDRDMALAQAGFAIAASKNPNAFGAIGEGAQAGIGEYVKSRKEARSLDAERIKAQIAAAANAGEMGQKQGVAEFEMGQRERISDREIGSRERLAKAQLSQSAEIANIDALLKGRVADIDENYKKALLAKDTDEQRLLASLDPLKQGDISRGFAVSNAYKIINGNNDIISDYTATPEARAAAQRANDGLYKIIGMSNYTPRQQEAVDRYGEDVARAKGLID